jgi:hypothetical protein
MYIAFLYGFTSLRMQIATLTNIDDPIIRIIPLAFFGGSIMMLVRYYYLYVLYYSKFIFRSFVYLSDKDLMKSKV